MLPLVLVGLVLASAWWFGTGPAQPLSAAAGVAEVVVVSPDLTVYVSGAVREPGLVVVPSDARIADVVAAAGGALPGARLDALNLATAVRDGEHVDVPLVADGDVGSASIDGAVRVNQASSEEMERLPGVGPVLAARIVAWRDANGPFGTIEDMLDVPGIGEGKLAALRDVATVP